MFSVIIKTQGLGKAAPSNAKYYVDDIEIGSGNIPEIPSGGTPTMTFTWKAQAGAHKIKAVADYYNSVTESNEANNETQIEFRGPAPLDLVIEPVSFSPGDITAGETVCFSFYVTKQSLSSWAKPFSVRCSIDGSNPVDTPVHTLYPWESKLVNHYYEGARSGKHKFKAIIDYDNSVPESVETNNTVEVQFTVP